MIKVLLRYRMLDLRSLILTPERSLMRSWAILLRVKEVLICHLWWNPLPLLILVHLLLLMD